MDKVFRLEEFGSTFATREKGKEVGALLERLAQESGHLVINCDGVRLVSYSFADEIFHHARSAHITLTNCSGDLLEVFDKILTRKGLVASYRSGNRHLLLGAGEEIREPV